MTLALKVKLRIAQALCSRPSAALVDLAFKGEVPAHGLRFAVGGPHVAPATRAALFFGLYERAEARFVRTLLRPDLDVVELGASLGVISSIVSRRLEPSRRLVCVEANPNLLPLVRENLARAAPGRDVAVVGGAVSYDVPEGSTVRLALGAWSNASRVGDDLGHGAVEAPAVRLSGLLARHGIGRYALVSDIEGAEAAILQEDPAALAGCQQAIVELHAAEHRGRPLGVEDLAERFRGLGFRVAARRGPVHVFAR